MMHAVFVVHGAFALIALLLLTAVVVSILVRSRRGPHDPDFPHGLRARWVPSVFGVVAFLIEMLATCSLGGRAPFAGWASPSDWFLSACSGVMVAFALWLLALPVAAPVISSPDASVSAGKSVGKSAQKTVGKEGQR